jgi:hypothetical protein
MGKNMGVRGGRFGGLPSVIFVVRGFFMRCYLVHVIVFPCQSGGVHCSAHVLRLRLPSLPPPSLSGCGNYYTLKRFFRCHKKAHMWASYMRTTYTTGPTVHPLLSAPVFNGGQLSLF